MQCFRVFRTLRDELLLPWTPTLQHPPDVIPRLLEEWSKGSKIVHTVRIDHQSTSRIRRLVAQLFNKCFTCLSGVQLSTAIAHFRLLDQQVVEQVLQLKESGLFFRGLVHWLGFPSSKVEFECRGRYSVVGWQKGLMYERNQLDRDGCQLGWQR